MRDTNKDILKEFSEDIIAIQSRMMGWMDELIDDALNPESLLRVFAGMGLDPSQVPGIGNQNNAIDPYQILGLDKSASDDEVKKRYRELAHILHPDKSKTHATTFFFKQVMVAYQLIARERGW